jgi:hypothetical protein
MLSAWSLLVLVSSGSDNFGIVATTASSSSAGSTSSSKNHPLLPWTTRLWGGAMSTKENHRKGSGGMVLGQDEEATESLEISIPLSQSATLSKNDAPLMRDIEMLTEILSDLVQHENPRVHDLYEEFLQYGQQR